MARPDNTSPKTPAEKKKPPKTPPQEPAHGKAPASEELREEEAHPGETLKNMTKEEKGTPPGAKSSWN